ncbi:MAG: type 4a pilus biogenesis protein PilO [Candidatus Fermentibacteraceae bacterium]
MAIDFRDARVLRFIIGILLLAAIVVGYFMFLAKGLSEEIAVEEQNLEMRRIEHQSLRSRTSEDLAVMAQRIEMYTQELNTLDRLLPRVYDQEEVMEMLTNGAGRSGLTILSLTPMQYVPEGEYLVYDWQVRLTGRFHRLGVFLDQLTQEMLMSAVTNLEIHQQKAAEGKFDNIEASFTFRAFVQP